MNKEIIEKSNFEQVNTELRKSQSLALFREWLSKHPFLSGAPQGQ